jgi:hypothetical protein
VAQDWRNSELKRGYGRMTKDCAERILDDWQSERDTEELVAMNGHGVRSGRAGRSA